MEYYLRAVVVEDFEGGTPSGQLLLPVVHGGGGDDDEVGAFVAHFLEVSQEGDGLDGLSQPHLVGQDAVQRLLVHQHQPVEPERTNIQSK